MEDIGVPVFDQVQVASIGGQDDWQSRCHCLHGNQIGAGLTPIGKDRGVRRCEEGPNVLVRGHPQINKGPMRQSIGE